MKNRDCPDTGDCLVGSGWFSDEEQLRRDHQILHAVRFTTGLHWNSEYLGARITRSGCGTFWIQPSRMDASYRQSAIVAAQPVHDIQRELLVVRTWHIHPHFARWSSRYRDDLRGQTGSLAQDDHAPPSDFERHALRPTGCRRELSSRRLLGGRQAERDRVLRGKLGFPSE